MGHISVIPHSWSESYEYEGKWYMDCERAGCDHHLVWEGAMDRWSRYSYPFPSPMRKTQLSLPPDTSRPPGQR